MRITQPVTLGPYFVKTHTADLRNGHVEPLDAAMEWANSRRAARIPLFKRLPILSPAGVRFEHVIVRGSDLPCDIACEDYRVIHTRAGLFVPLDAVLIALYCKDEISRPISALLDELAQLVPLSESITDPIDAAGLVLGSAEARGYRLSAAFAEPGWIYTQVAWEPNCRQARFHVCLAAFEVDDRRRLNCGRWIPPREVGVSQLLASELHRLAPSTPLDLLTDSGRRHLEHALPH